MWAVESVMSRLSSSARARSLIAARLRRRGRPPAAECPGLVPADAIAGLPSAPRPAGPPGYVHAVSLESVEVVVRGYRAFIDGDFEAIAELLDPDIEWYPLEAGRCRSPTSRDALGVVADRYREQYRVELDGASEWATRSSSGSAPRARRATQTTSGRSSLGASSASSAPVDFFVTAGTDEMAGATCSPSVKPVPIGSGKMASPPPFGMGRLDLGSRARERVEPTANRPRWEDWTRDLAFRLALLVGFARPGRLRRRPDIRPDPYRDSERMARGSRRQAQAPGRHPKSLVNLFGEDLRHIKVPEDSGLRDGGIYLANSGRSATSEPVLERDPATGKTVPSRGDMPSIGSIACTATASTGPATARRPSSSTPAPATIGRASSSSPRPTRSTPSRPAPTSGRRSSTGSTGPRCPASRRS